MRQEKSSLLRNKGFQSLLASLLCIVLGLLIGYIVLLIINPAGAGEAIRTIVENFLYYPSAAARLRYLGNTLVKTAPLLMCSLSVLFAYKVGLFNIGAAGQYVRRQPVLRPGLRAALVRVPVGGYCCRCGAGRHLRAPEGVPQCE